MSLGLSLAAAILAAGCGQTPDIVTAGLIDPRDSPAWPGASLYIVEVHRTPMAPFEGTERLWRRSHGERVDTVPGIRAIDPVRVVGESRVIGFHAEEGSAPGVFEYDAFSRTLRLSPLPKWFSEAVLSPPPTFAPRGRHVLFLARRPDGMMRVEVHAWPDGAPVLVGLPIRTNPNSTNRWLITWGNASSFIATVPVVSDTGPVWMIFNGRVTGGSASIDSGTRYVDFRRPPSAPIPMQPPSAFPEVPSAFQRELVSRGCSVPQSDSGSNVIQGHFGSGSQTDWAVLCSLRGSSSIVVHWGGTAQCPSELRRAPDGNYQMRLGERLSFTRSIHTTARYQVHDNMGRPVLPERFVDLKYDAIEDVNGGWGSTVWFCQRGKWVEFPGRGSQKSKVLH